MLFQKHLQQLQHREGFSHETVLKHMSLLQEKVRQYRIPVPRARMLMGVPQPRESEAQTKTTARGVSALGPAEGEGRSLQHPTPAWRSCRGIRRSCSDPENEINLSEPDKPSLLSQGIHRVGWGYRHWGASQHEWIKTGSVSRHTTERKAGSKGSEWSQSLFMKLGWWGSGNGRKSPSLRMCPLLATTSSYYTSTFAGGLLMQTRVA